MLIRDEWTSNGRFRDRVENPRDGGGPVLGGTGVRLEPGDTVRDDDSADLLLGLGGHDWRLDADADFSLSPWDRVFANALELLLD